MVPSLKKNVRSKLLHPSCGILGRIAKYFGASREVSHTSIQLAASKLILLSQVAQQKHPCAVGVNELVINVKAANALGRTPSRLARADEVIKEGHFAAMQLCLLWITKAVISQLHLSTCLGRAKNLAGIGTAFTRGERQFQP